MDQLTLWDCVSNVKHCCGCKRMLPPEAFRPYRWDKARRSATCYRCLILRHKKYWKDPNAATAKVRAWQDKHVEKLRQKRKDSWSRHLAAKGQSRKLIRKKEESEAYRKQQERIYNASPKQRQKCREYMRKKWESEPEVMKRRSREWNAKNKAGVRAKRLKWIAKNKPRRAEFERRRKARKLNATIGNTKEIQAFYMHVHNSPGVVCNWCKKEIAAGRRHVDHIVALANGGAHALFNLCPSCPECNCRKSNLSPEEFNERLKNEYRTDAA